jgi:glycosyltransferase involved in cell wall biosynthesis
MKVTFFGTYDLSTTQRVEGLIDGLRAHHIPVHECNAPLKLNTAMRVKIASQPWRLPILLLHLARCWAKLMWLARRVPPSDAVVIGYLGHFDIHLARLLFRRRPLVLDYMVSGSDTANDRRVGGGGLKQRVLKWIDNAALKKADIVVLDTEEHRQRLPEQYRHKGVVVNVGVPANWSAVKPTALTKQAEEPLSVIFHGAFTPLQGTPVIGKAIARLKTPMRITMVGTGQDYAETKRLATKSKAADITWIDWIKSPDLPQAVANHDVCLGIFGKGPKTYRVVPNKMYQGAAAGCALITADTPPQRRVLEDAALFVSQGDPKALAAALERLANHPEELTKLKKASRRVANGFTPDKIVEPLIAKLRDRKP